MTNSAITQEDYAKNPQAVLDVLEFYTDRQKRELDELGMGELPFRGGILIVGSIESVQVLQPGSTLVPVSVVLQPNRPCCPPSTDQASRDKTLPLPVSHLSNMRTCLLQLEQQQIMSMDHMLLLVNLLALVLRDHLCLL